MIKIMLISNMEKFLEKVQNCYGDVLLHLQDDTVINLKEDHTAIELLKMWHSSNRELDISLTDVRDYATIMNFMMSSAAA